MTNKSFPKLPVVGGNDHEGSISANQMIMLSPKMKTVWLSFLVAVFTRISSSFISEDVASFYQAKNVRFVTGFLCNEQDKIKLLKRLGEISIRCNFPKIETITSYGNLSTVLHYTSNRKSGVFIDLKCPQSVQILEIASDHMLFDITHHWLILSNEYFTKEEFEEISIKYEPKMFDIKNYLDFGTKSMKHGVRIRELNFAVNDDIINDPEVVAMMQRPPENISGIHFDNSKKINVLVNLKALVNSEVTLAVPDNLTTDYNLYEIHKKTQFTRMFIEYIGKMSRNELEPTSAVLKRKDFNGTLLRATAGLFYFSYYSKSDELQPFTYDRWAIKDTQLSILTAKQLNYRIVIKLFDDYGWGVVNGRYTGMLRHFSEYKTDMTAGGLLMVDARFDAVTWVNNIFKVRLALIFKQPSLSQVANIFALPFETDVWLAVLALLITTSAILYSQLRIIRKLDTSVSSVKFNEVFTFLTGAACQQGTDLTTNILSARVTMLVFLVASLFLFTSYTANIVSLLQSSSDSIKTVRDFAGSSLEMGVENLPFQINLVETDNDPLIRKLYKKKLSQKVVKGTAYVDSQVGMESVRKGLYAFHTEAETGARIISATFTETEKRQIKTIPLFPLKFNGHAVVKKSPFYEILSETYHWYNEVGFMTRTDRRFGYVIPKATGQMSGGFNSIGLSDIRNVFMMLAYGMVTSLAFLLIEKCFYCFHQKPGNYWKKDKNK